MDYLTTEDREMLVGECHQQVNRCRHVSTELRKGTHYPESELAGFIDSLAACIHAAATDLRNPVDPWVPVEDGLPLVTGWHLCWNSAGTPEVLLWDAETFRESWGGREVTVTHWQRINPPKDGQ